MVAPKLTSKMWQSARISSSTPAAAPPCSAVRPVKAIYSDPSCTRYMDLFTTALGTLDLSFLFRFNIAKSLVFSGEYDDWIIHGDNNSGTWEGVGF